MSIVRDNLMSRPGYSPSGEPNFETWFERYAPTAPEILDECAKAAWMAAIEACAKLCDERASIEKQKANNARGRKEIALGQMYDQNSDQAMLMAQEIRERSKDL